MRSDPTEFALTAPTSLAEVLTLLASAPHTPIAGGTELMVALAAGRLTTHSLLSIQHLPELRFIHITPTTITLGANTTFTDIRRNPTFAADLPLLTLAASWTGSIANQNRATLGGNLCNASPAADTPPALLVYNATVTLISASAAPGENATRTIPYADFHLAYKRTALYRRPTGERRNPPLHHPPPHLHPPPPLHPQSRNPQRSGHLQNRPRHPRAPQRR